MNKICILYERDLEAETDEVSALESIVEAKAHAEFSLCYDRYVLPENSLVVPRYLDVRDYKDLEIRAYQKKARLINSYAAHKFVADIRAYFPFVKEWTFPVYGVGEADELPEGAYIVKGITNSLKFQWKTHMYAESKAALLKNIQQINESGLLDGQDLVIRPYVPLKQLGTTDGGLPLSNEWRLFALGGTVFSAGFYWPQLKEPIRDKPIPEDAVWLAETVAREMADRIDFVAIDVAETASGEWALVELNDGCTSGLSCINSSLFYKDLLDILTGEYLETVS